MILLIKEPSGKPIAQLNLKEVIYKTTHILNTKISQIEHK